MSHPANGTIRARTRFRDHDGQLRRIEASGDTRTKAEHRLKERLAARSGYSTGFGELVGRVVDRVGRDATVSVHCHNDLGLATANTLAAVQAGAGVEPHVTAGHRGGDVERPDDTILGRAEWQFDKGRSVG